MLNIFKKTAPKETGVIGSPVKGTIIKIDEVEDETFSSKMLGDGFAVIPQDSKFVSPCDGEISMIFATGHAYGVTSVDGIEILVHIGIDTVEENGKGFRILKKAGDKVMRGDTIIEVDLDYLKAKYNLVTPCIITNLCDIKSMEKNYADCNLTVTYKKL